LAVPSPLSFSDSLFLVPGYCSWLVFGWYSTRCLWSITTANCRSSWTIIDQKFNYSDSSNTFCRRGKFLDTFLFYLPRFFCILY
jgi:hypothetical protein